MTNSLLTPTLITRRSIELFRNVNPFLQMMDRQWQDDFGSPSVAGQKPGATIGIRMPNSYTLRTGPTAVPQSTNEVQTTLTVAKQVGVDISFSMVDRTLSLQDYSQRILEPAINTIVGGIAADVMSGTEAIPNLIHNVDGSNNTLTPTLTTWAMAGALLDKLSTPRGQRKAILDPITMARTVSSFSGLFNNQAKVGNQYNTAMIGAGVLGMDWAQDATVIPHTTGSYATPPTVNGASQTGTTITVSAVGGSGFRQGDVITFAGVYATNRVTNVSTGQLAQFVLTANVAAGATSLPIYPALIPAVGGVAVPFQTVSASPANGAAVACLTNAGETYRKNFIFVPQAVTLAVVPMEMPTRGVVESYRESYQGISIRLITFYDGINDQTVTRLDLLYGYKWVRPEWAAVVADAL